MPQSLILRRPDDWHLHLRDGAMLAAVLPFTARPFARAIIMPNLVPPVTDVASAVAYRARIRAALPSGADFTPLMTCYLTDTTDPDEIERGARAGVFAAVKLYPAKATTNSAHGVTDIAKTYGALERMASLGLPLLVHGEVTDADVDVFDREAVFVERVLAPLHRRLPALKIVLEHVTTAEAVAFVSESGPSIAATITAHHLVINRNALFVGGLRPHMYCLPIAKREKHRQALRRAATSGNAKFFLGTRLGATSRARQGECLRLRRHLHRAGGARDLCPGLRRGGRARSPGVLRLAQRSALLWLAAERAAHHAAPNALAHSAADRCRKHRRRAFLAGEEIAWAIED